MNWTAADERTKFESYLAMECDLSEDELNNILDDSQMYEDEFMHWKSCQE